MDYAGLSHGKTFIRGNICLKNKVKIFILMEGDKWRRCLGKALLERFLNEA